LHLLKRAKPIFSLYIVVFTCGLPVQVNRVVDERRQMAAAGRLVTIEDIAMMLLGADLKNINRQGEMFAVLLAVALQRLALR